MFNQLQTHEKTPSWTTTLNHLRNVKHLPKILLTTLALSTATPMFQSCSDEPNNPNNSEIVDENDLKIRFYSGDIDISQSPTIKIEDHSWMVKKHFC